jgi:transketolase
MPMTRPRGPTYSAHPSTDPCSTARRAIANSVGMAIARKWLACRYNKTGFDLFDYNIYAVCGDGCLMEGVGSEAASLAGHLALDDLCWIYDNNHITIVLMASSSSS